jgi:hypothetical protein
MISSRLIKSNNTAAGCLDIVDNYDPFGGDGVALYQLNGNANDVSGNYNGTATSVTYGTGVFGQAGVFNGTSSKIDLSNLGLGGSATRTISAWINVNSLSAHQTIFQFGSNADKERFGFDVTTAGKLEISTYNRDITTTSAQITVGSWFNVAVTYNGGAIDTATNTQIYVNGSAVAMSNIGTTTGILSTGNANYAIGYDRLNTRRYFNGSIDQVRIFNTALLPLEVEALYIEELCICDGTVDTLDILEDASCIALYPLNGNANDLSGNYSGTPTAVSYGVGEFDLAADFNGSTSKIDLPLTTLGNNSFSITMWLKFDSVGSGSTQQYIFNKYNGSASGTYGIQCQKQANQNTIRFNMYNTLDAIYGIVTTTTAMTVGVWYNYVLVFNSGTSITAYLNGNSEATTSTSGTFAQNTADLRLGAYWAGSAFLNGSIDQVRIFNKALSAGEVTTLYNETACTPAACTSGTTNTLNILGDGSCIATYTLDGTPADLSGNYNGVQTDVTYPQGYFDLAGSFNGSSTYIETLSEVVTTNSYSISCWVKQNNKSTDTAYGRIWSQQSNSNKGFYFGKQNNTIDYVFQFGTAFSLDLNETFKHLVISFDSTGGATGAKTYLNGVLVNTQAYPGFHTSAQGYLNSNFRIGRQFSTFGEYWNGGIDQFRVFNKALTAGEVTTLYNETPCN